MHQNQTVKSSNVEKNTKYHKTSLQNLFQKEKSQQFQIG